MATSKSTTGGRSIEREHVYVGEAWRDGERLERVVHTTEAGAWEDIEVMAGDEADHLLVEEERVYLGPEAKDEEDR